MRGGIVLLLHMSTLTCIMVYNADVSAHLPAPRSLRIERKTRAIVVSIPRFQKGEDKRAVASRLLSNAASHKRHSLRDVLAFNPKKTNSILSFRRLSRQNETSLPMEGHQQTQMFLAVANQFFPSQKNSSTFKAWRPAVSLHVDTTAESKVGSTLSTTQTDESANYDFSSIRGEGLGKLKYTNAERQLLYQSINALQTNSPSRASAALRTVEELCHSIHNGRALEQSGGFRPILSALSSRHRPVRAAAAWAIATCCQNNPSVQRAALHAGAVPTLARLAWQDVLTVRARALFALNAILGMEEARIAFENLPFATQVLTTSLRDNRDYRAVRRALNLVELLVCRNLDAWKTQLEAWDVPTLVEKLMREHSDIDVRESAARIIAALDGKNIA